MPLILYAHPFSSYCQKVQIALYEHGIEVDYRLLGPGEERNFAEHAALWPLRKFPVLRDGERTLTEATVIIEYLDIHYAGASRLLPMDPDAALPVRLLDRVFDNYVMTPMQKIVADSLRPEAHRDPHGVEEARAQLESAYHWLDERVGTGPWATGDCFTLADCAAAPSLFYADWVHPIPASLGGLRAYRQRLLQRPSFARAVDEARPYRSLFPLGAPDQD